MTHDFLKKIDRYFRRNFPLRRIQLLKTIIVFLTGLIIFCELPPTQKVPKITDNSLLLSNNGGKCATSCGEGLRYLNYRVVKNPPQLICNFFETRSFASFNAEKMTCENSNQTKTQYEYNGFHFSDSELVLCFFLTIYWTLFVLYISRW